MCQWSGLLPITLALSFLQLGSACNVVDQCGSGPTSCPKRNDVRPYEGSCNIPAEPRCGSAGSEYVRLLPARNGPGGEGFPLTSSGRPFPNAEWISEKLFPVKDTSDPRYTLAAMQYGQLITHDIGFTATFTSPLSCCSWENQFIPPPKTYKCASIDVSESSFYQSCHAPCMSMFRTYNNQHNNCSSWRKSPEKLNLVSATLDLHLIYGISNTSDELGNGQLRAYERGQLKTSVRNDQEFFQDIKDNRTLQFCYSIQNSPLCYYGGDPRMNQNAHLSILEIIYLREHNRLAGELEKLNPHWCDEKIFQAARQINIATHQHISFSELLPVYMGDQILYKNKILYKSRSYVEDYDPTVCPAAITEFSHAAFRDFHSMIKDVLELRTDNRTLAGNILIDDWYNNPVIVERKFNQLTTGMFTQASGASDINHVRGVNRRLLPRCIQHEGKLAPNCLSCGLNLKAIDIQRGRDHGIPSYNDMREYCGFKKAKRWEDFYDHIEKKKVEKLKEIYENIDDVELVPAGSYEKRIKGALTGPVFMCILKIQFFRTRVGDLFWYEHRQSGLSLEQLEEIRKATISKLICNNSNITMIQPQGFLTISDNNTLTSCSNLPSVNLSKWKEELKFNLDNHLSL